MDLEIRHLRLVSVVAERQSLVNASDALHLTQSALSHQLRYIEERLSARLFLRGHRRMTLTPAGERLLKTARVVLKELDTVEQAITSGTSGRIPLRVSVESCTRYHWLAPVLSRLHERHPLVDVTLDVDAAKAPNRALFDGTLDVAIVSTPIKVSRVVVQPLFEDELVVLLAARHPLTRQPFVRLTDLRKERLLTFVPRDQCPYFADLLDPADVTPAAVQVVPSSEAMFEIARAGAGVAILPRWILGPRTVDSGLRTMPITADGVFTTWRAAVARHLAAVNYVEEFLRVFMAEVGVQRAGARWSSASA